MQDDRCTCMGKGTVTFGGSPDGDGEDAGGNGVLDPDRSMGCPAWAHGCGDAGVSCIVTVEGSPNNDGEGD